MASVFILLLYIALKFRCDILWVVVNLIKSCSEPGLIKYEPLMHDLRYLCMHSSFEIRYYANMKYSPVYNRCEKIKSLTCLVSVILCGKISLTLVETWVGIISSMGHGQSYHSLLVQI